ncbi:serine/arginine repetitive matrix protein 2-like [Perognathus longimembris pacificus]|uniref:serine/arginine repetitive matrix protein 2-like n=1 Tax=Perognathus longimembris pacificus TaxID=214514 RepID=UPI0020199428|nr:serine/arginine repetitive matrix protein 2-like [Perognathus longimembris pacificus]
MRLHLGDEAAAEPRGSASTSRGSLLTLHREEAAAAAGKEEEAVPKPAPAQSPAAAEWPPASPQDPPPRLRRAAHRARRARSEQLRRPHAVVYNGRVERVQPAPLSPTPGLCEHPSSGKSRALSTFQKGTI